MEVKKGQTPCVSQTEAGVCSNVTHFHWII